MIQERGRAENLAGRKFGRLTALYRVENRKDRVCWRCLCDCGRYKDATAHDLKAGKIKSCGCLIHEVKRPVVELKGRRFGRLTVIEETDGRDEKGTVVWKCRCDCGQEIYLSENKLVHGNYKSCGCLKKENQKIIHDQLHFVDGTCLEMIGNRKYRRDNVSGFRGVFRSKGGRWRVSIGFKGKRYYIGSYSSYDEAVRVRISAEEQIYTGFINGYQEWKKKAEKDPGWADENPFLFEVEKSDGELKIISS